MLIKVPDRLKTSAPGRCQPLLSFSRFHNHANICVISLLEHFLDHTKDLRPGDCDFLFISLIRPYKAVRVQTLSRWIRETLMACGVNDSFTAHSTRHASTSFAAKKGTSVEVPLIKRAAGWTGESRVFAKFYNRLIVDSNAFANTILSS